MNSEYINAESACRVAQMSRCGTKWGAVVSVLGVVAVMASGVYASGCAVGSHQVGDLVSFFPLDGTLVDDLSSATMASSTTAYHTDATHGPVLNANGNVYTITSPALATVLDASAFTVSFWIYFVSLPSDDHLNILTRWDNYDAPYSATGGFVIMVSNTQKLQFAASMQSYYSATTLQISRWYHLSVVKTSGSSVDLYLDGVLDVRWTAATRAMLNPINDIGMGSYCYSSSPPSTAATCTTATNNAMFYLMDLRFYSRALSGTEVATLATRADHQGDACTACQAGLTTVAPGAESVKACVCVSGSYSAAPRVAFNPSGGAQTFPGTALNKYPGQSSGNEVQGTDYIDFGPLDWNIASNGGFTAVGKFKTHSSSNHWMRVFELSDDLFQSQTLGIAVLQVGTGTGWRQSIYVDGQFSCYSETVTVLDNAVNTFIMRYDAASSTLYPTFNGVDQSSVTCSVQLGDYASLPWNMIAAPVYNDNYLHGEIYGVIAYDYFLTKEDAQDVLNGIKTDTVNVVNTQCAVCPPEKPYTDPSQGATAEAQCQATDTDKPKCDEGVSVFSYWSIRKC